MGHKLSKYRTGFQKFQRKQRIFLTFLEGMKKCSKGKEICHILMDLSKTFNTINHDLLLAKSKSWFFYKIV